MHEVNEEVDSVVEKSRLTKFENIPILTLLHAFIQESRRIHSAFIGNLSQRCA